jgi:hypothetical protein
MTLIIEIPDYMEAVLHERAKAQGVSAVGYARRVLEQALVPQGDQNQPLRTGRGLLAKYGPAPSAEEIDANRADMFRGFAEQF